MPHQFGGSNSPDNYALLCRRCHRDAPDTPRPELMVRWIARRELYSTTLAAEVMAARPLDLAQRWVEAGRPDADIASVMNFGGIHRDPTDGAEMSLATLAAVGVEAMEAAISSQAPGQLRLL